MLAIGGSFSFLTQILLQASVHLLLLVLAMVLESYLRLNHRWRQQLGYLRFYRNTRHLLSVPFYAVSCSIAASLLVELWPEVLHQLCPHLKLVRWFSLSLRLSCFLYSLTLSILSLCILSQGGQSSRKPLDVACVYHGQFRLEEIESWWCRAIEKSWWIMFSAKYCLLLLICGV